MRTDHITTGAGAGSTAFQLRYNAAVWKLVEERSGSGELRRHGDLLRAARYRIRRYQGVMEGSGLPVPGLHRIEGTIDFDALRDPGDWIGARLDLRLEDGRVLGITLRDRDGRILEEGHGPAKCLCC